MSSMSRSKLLILAPSRLLGLVEDRAFLGQPKMAQLGDFKPYLFTVVNWDHHSKYGWKYMYVFSPNHPPKESAKIFCLLVPISVLLYVLSA